MILEANICYLFHLTKIFCIFFHSRNFGEDVFKGVNRMNCNLYVMEGTKSSYLSTTPWSGFYNIEEWNPNGPKEILVKDITLSASQKEMNVGDASSLTVTITPEDATNMTLKWSSSNSSVVSVDSKGNLYAFHFKVKNELKLLIFHL